MKKTIKLSILFILIFSSILFGIQSGFLKGFIMIVVSFVGVFILEYREVNRMIEYFHPLVFRCGRDQYVEENLDLFKRRLLFTRYFQKKLLYLEAGLNNIKGRYSACIECIEKSYPVVHGIKDDNLLVEYQYAKLKIDKAYQLQDMREGHREQLCEILYLLNMKKIDQAEKCLLALRQEETGNVIFREVNLLLSELYTSLNSEEATYYKMIADSFYNEER